MRVAIAACAALLLGAAPAPRFGPAPKNAQYAAVQRYVDALRAARYDDAYALLTDAERRYFGDASAYRSVFDADGYALQSASIVGARGDERGRVFFVREKISYVDHATDKRRVLDATVPLGVLAENGRQHVKDPGKPYRAFAPAATAEASGLRVTVKKVDFFPDRVDVVLTFANIGDGFVTVLPYNKSVLRDDRGGVYRVLALKDWTVTDKRLFEGIPLAPSSQYTGAMAFVAQRFGDVKRRWSLTVAPALRDGADAPFEVTITIPPPG
ncbi:MAG: hypothetical protein JOZ24_09305 [Candidatus Eremiobacteraeota bacterium]|nr:hypothetical protein [Candidatus Eremiobacteraeota bacterium]